MMCVLGGIFYLYEYFLRVAPSVMLADLQLSYSISLNAVGILSAAYYYSYSPLQLPVGIIIDKFGPRRVLTTACLLCAIGTYMFANGESYWLAYIGRFLVGAGSAFAFVGVLKIATVWLDPKYFALVAGLCTALGMIGAITGQAIMSQLVQSTGWQNAMYYSVVLGIILTVIIWIFIRDEPAENAEKYLYPQRPEPPLITSLIQISTNKLIWVAGCVGFLTFMPISVFAEFWGYSFFTSCGFSNNASSLANSLLFIGFGVGGPIWGIISDLIKSRKVPIFIGTTLAAIFMWAALTLTPGAQNSPLVVYGLMFLVGLMASAQVLVFAVGNDESEPNLRGTTLAFINMITMLGGGFVQPMIGIIADMIKTSVATSPDAVFLGLSAGNDVMLYKISLMLVPIGLLLSGILVLFGMKESYKR